MQTGVPSGVFAFCDYVSAAARVRVAHQQRPEQPRGEVNAKNSCKRLFSPPSTRRLPVPVSISSGAPKSKRYLPHLPYSPTSGHRAGGGKSGTALSEEGFRIRSGSQDQSWARETDRPWVAAGNRCIAQCAQISPLFL